MAISKSTSGWAMLPSTCSMILRPVERISIDEAFADVVGCTHLFGPPAEIAAEVRRRLRAEVGLPMSIGATDLKLNLHTLS